MKNIHIIIISVVLIVAGLALRLSYFFPQWVRVFGALALFIGLFLFSFYIYDELKKDKI